jgi:hypothetical protein
MKRIIVAVFLTAVFTACVRADPVPVPTFALIPTDGVVNGPPGTVVGWGFNLTDNSSDWVLLDSSSFSGSNLFGTYVDYLANNFYLAGPAPESATITQAWNRITTSGVGEFDINPTTQPGISITGNIVVHYTVFSVDPNDPNFDPNTDVVLSDATISGPVTIETTPEPSPRILLLSAMLALLALRRWRKMPAR